MVSLTSLLTESGINSRLHNEGFYCYKTTRQEHWIESIDERVESSREFNFNAAFLELSRSENCLRYVPIIAATWQHS
ncbi:hypothetical protein HOLleu_20125 [Holothuria leucospilota]|uniref:Uncharacterized protein n=1 Tax=Holothuria leucospilota TaxID=206669 RepID=A0A9Q1C0C1_HOLLE|nr:hypothetical protein HOLleu_20125 [Holothuria leucospilota]